MILNSSFHQFRDTDRMAIFPFSNTVAHSEDFSQRQNKFYEMLSSHVKPFDFMVFEGFI